MKHFRSQVCSTYQSMVEMHLKASKDPWTTTHGHFLQMGGFRLLTTARENFVETYHTPELRTRKLIAPGAQYQPKNGNDIFKTITHRILQITGKDWPGVISERDISRIDFGDDIWEGVLTISTLKNLLSENLIRFPSITEDEINDRSKGDALSKGIALLQLTWFIIQVIARAVQGLAITELELTTAALAGLNGIMYFFWWSKPRDVQFPVLIRTKGVEHQLSSTSDDKSWIFSDVAFSFRRQLWATIAHPFARMTGNLRSFLGSLSRKSVHAFVALALGLRSLQVRFTRLNSQIVRGLSFSRVKKSDIETALQRPFDEVTGEADPQSSSSSRAVKTVTKTQLFDKYISSDASLDLVVTSQCRQGYEVSNQHHCPSPILPNFLSVLPYSSGSTCPHFTNPSQ